ncbi:uncharacterized protein HD556DRAFT_761599 [Suillus plorans]|uniref:Uncharacterized protein n=1 Tax=Suillus plorans TaxID=116603 RepID=A0A9P7DEP6_9AGAM|nr:uncharacterized protein HD556DRAFT_761599 [Suillus plorans]KAG1789887.1 hypothetical protein HD556DRAFT_761599 [Suillus plorans]
MSTHHGDTSRKPSGSSTRSSGHSPSASPNNSQRNLTPTTANMFGVAIAGASGLKGLNSGWQVWGSTTPASKKNASISSAASVTDLSPSQAESGYRGNLGESWSAPRPSSGTWDELSGSPQKKEFSQLDTNSPLSLHHARQRQATAAQAAALSGPRVDDRSSAKAGQFSPQRFDNTLGKETGVSNRYAASSNASGYGSSAFGGQNGGFDSLQSRTIMSTDNTATNPPLHRPVLLLLIPLVSCRCDHPRKWFKDDSRMVVTLRQIIRRIIPMAQHATPTWIMDMDTVPRRTLHSTLHLLG